MIKEIEISVPTSYSDISLKKWLNLQKEMKNYEGDTEAVTALILYHLCGLQLEYIKGLSMDGYSEIKNELASFMQNVELPLQRFIKIGDVEYGFEPNLSKMAYGAYADISKFNTIAIDDNWAKTMNILYRPVTKKHGEMYSIKPYTGDEYWEKFLDVPMDVHFGALFFFIEFTNKLVKFYPEIFDGGGSSSQHQVNFGKKWGNYSAIVELAEGDVLRFDKVVEQPLEKCLLYLAYKTDKNELETLLHKEALKRNGL